jgi:hypothetical protein
MREFLDALWPETDSPFARGEFRMLRDGQVRQKFLPLRERDMDAAEKTIREADAQGWDVYFGVQPRAGQKGTAAYASSNVHVLWADLDTKQRTKQEAFAALGRITVPPAIIVDSGHGYHAYWLLTSTYGVAWSEVEAAMKGIALATGGDAVSDRARVLRVPGTHNHKPDHTDPLLGFGIPVRLVRFDPIGNAHPFSDFVDYADMGRKPVFKGGTLVPRTAWDPDVHPIPDRLSRKMDEDPGKGVRSEHAFSVVCSLVELGLDDAEIEDRIRSHPLGVGAKYFEKGRLGTRWLQYTIEAARRVVRAEGW